MSEKETKLDVALRHLNENKVYDNDIPTIRNMLNLIYGDVKADEICDERANKWPINLLQIIDSDSTDRTMYNDETLEVIEDRIGYVLKYLFTDQESTIILKRFKYGLSLQSIAEELNVTKQNIQQILQRALRKFRHPSRRNKVLLGIKYDDHIKELTEKVELKEKELANKSVLLRSKIDKLNTVLADLGFKLKLDTPDEQAEISLLNLSVRSYHCLKRARINTIKELTLMTKEDLKNVRNLGSVGVEEIISKLEKLGFSLKIDESDPDFVPVEIYGNEYVE